MSGITDPTEEYFKDGCWGWDGSQWLKQGILFGYNDVIQFLITDTAGGGESDKLSSDAVPNGELWVVHNVAAYNLNHAPSRIVIFHIRGSISCPLLDTTTTGAAIWTIWNGTTVMKVGSYLRAYFFGCTSGDTLKLAILGYKVKVT